MSAGSGPPSSVRQVSPDGKWIWDGKQWLPFTGPPTGPPRMSPDGRWVWDGKQWLPIARREAVFPAWSVVTDQAEPAPVAETKPELAPIPVIGPEGEVVTEEAEPEFNPYTYEEPTKPAWERAETGYNRYIYVAAGVIVLIMAALIINAMGPIQLPWMAQDNTAPLPSPTPPLAARTDAAKADRLLSGYVGPAYTTLTQTAGIVNEECTGLLAFSCRDAMRETDKQVTTIISILDHQTAISCIAAPVTKLRADLVAMQTALTLALKAYPDNKTSELSQGLAGYHSSSAAVAADLAAAASLQKTVCSSALIGP
ncbi:MAG: hypothetical protein ACHQ0J_04185 [Candidatus Dormibacterales bacterium]